MNSTNKEQTTLWHGRDAALLTLDSTTPPAVHGAFFDTRPKTLHVAFLDTRPGTHSPPPSLGQAVTVA